MTEKNLNKKKNGIAVLLLSFVIYAVSIYGLIYKSGVLFGISLFFVCTTWLLWPGLKVIQPQEALVLTLFGKYVGTLKEPGFYFVNPFCSSVNPASRTRLRQSGDYDAG